MDGLRTLHAHDPVMFSTPILADRFRISPEAVRRILKSKWVPDVKRKAKMMQAERETSQQLLERREAAKRQKKEKLRSFYMDEESDRLFSGGSEAPQGDSGVPDESSARDEAEVDFQDDVDPRHEFDDPMSRKKKSVPIHYR